jgi:hypothetical protein
MPVVSMGYSPLPYVKHSHLIQQRPEIPQF